MALSILPTDVLVLVLRYLGIQDIISFRQACKHFHEITQLRSIWLSLLHSRVVHQNIPVPRLDGRSLETLNTAELELCISDALRLYKTWTGPSPQPIRRRTFSTDCPGPSQVVSMHFLPGRGLRWLLSLTLTPSEERTHTIQCWDISGESPRCIARRTLSGLRGFRVNTDGSHPGVLAVRAASGISIWGIDFTAPTSDAGFFAVQVLEDVTETLHVFTATTLLTKFNDQQLHLRTLENPSFAVELRNPTFIEPKECLDAIISDNFAVLMRTTTLEVYSLASFRASTGSHTLEPVSSHTWQWRIDSVSLAYQPSSRADGLPAINLLIRYASLFPWPVNALHHYVLPRDPSYNVAEDVTPNNLPYTSRAVLIQSIASPIRLFARWDMVLGRYGTALWIDSHTEDHFALAVEGQRLAGIKFAVTQTEEGETVDLRELVASSHASSVYDVREDDGWMRIAVDDEEGKIALGTTSGQITLLEYI
uniref:F-box domain-containing protein n=1 Tax=Mycena chlorophos TaxID=658473 RepID=A0ABQ0LQT8_MYCCL|nr:predicted protein [Mycena chlorophos]